MAEVIQWSNGGRTGVPSGVIGAEDWAMVPQLSRQTRRQMFTDDSNCKFVDRDEFCRLMLGFTQMVRVDDAASGLRGLRDMATGMLYVIEHDKLNRALPRT